MREMFDAIAPRYDLVNRIMTFRLDVRWRRRAVRLLGLPAGSRVLDLASGTGDLCIDLAGAGHRPISVDLSLGMLRADRSGAPRVQADILRLPLPDGAVDGVTCGFALRNLVDLGAFFDELARVVRPGGRIALLDVGIPHNRIVRWGHGVYFGQVVPRIGGWLSDAAAYRYLPAERRLPPVAGRAGGRCCAGAGFADAEHAELQRRHHPTAHRHRRRDARRHRRLLDRRRRPQRRRRRRRLPVRARRRRDRRARRGAAWTASTRPPRVLAAIDRRRRTSAGGRPRRGRRVAVRPRRSRGETGRSRPSRSASGRRRRVGHRRSTTRRCPRPAGPRPAPAAAELTCTRPVAPIERTSPPSRPPATRCATGSSPRPSSPGRSWSRPTARSTSTPCCAACAARSGRATAIAVDGFIGASPELLVDVDGDVVRSHPLAGTAPRTGDADHRRRDSPPQLIASTKDQVEHRVVIEWSTTRCCRGAATSTGSRSRRSSPSPTCSTSAPRSRAGSSQPPPDVIELVRALSPTPALGGHPGRRRSQLIAERRGRRSRPLRRRRRLGRRAGQRHLGRGHPLRRARHRPALAPGCIAGGGIVADSDPLAELAETQAKFQAMLSALIRP